MVLIISHILKILLATQNDAVSSDVAGHGSFQYSVVMTSAF